MSKLLYHTSDILKLECIKAKFCLVMANKIDIVLYIYLKMLKWFFRIYQAIKRLPNLVSALAASSHPTMQAFFISQLNDHIEDMIKFQEMVESTLDLSLVDRGEFLIKPEFDEELQGLFVIIKLNKVINVTRVIRILTALWFIMGKF